MFDREQIDQVRSALDIVDVVRDYVPSLKVAGRSVRGLCPFHSERTPSFHVHPEKGIFKCFGCGEAGDVITFVSKLEQVSFSEALEKLAERAGVVLKKRNISQEREPEGLREKLHRILALASRIYEDALWDDHLGKGARAYLKERGIFDQTARDFHLGVSSSRGTPVFEQIVKKGFPIDLCQQAGIVSRSASGRFYDPMFGRLIFPIYDSFGHVIGFGGRTLPNEKQNILGLGSDSEAKNEGPKYLNSPESPVFSKGKALYGLFQAKSAILSERKAIVLEGYMDVIGVTQGGVKNAVATLGTAFTRDHSKALKRYSVETVFGFFDADEAGRSATLRSLIPLLQEEIFPRIVVTTETKDPDEIILDKGKDFFDELLNTSPDFVDYMLRMGNDASREMTLQQKSNLARQLMEVISQSPNDILKSEWVSRVAQKLGVQADSLRSELKRVRSGPVEKKEERFAPKPSYLGKNKLPSAEEELFQLLMAFPLVWRELDLQVEDFVEEKHRVLFSLMQVHIREKEQVSVPRLSEEIDAKDRDWVLGLSIEEKEFLDPIERRDQLVRDIRFKKNQTRLRQLMARIGAGSASLDEQSEYKDLLRRLKGSAVSPA